MKEKDKNHDNNVYKHPKWQPQLQALTLDTTLFSSIDLDKHVD